MFESTGIGSYFAHNFMGAESNTSYIAGMNFSNLIIAIPIIATILLLISNFIRSKFTKYIPNGLFDCKFMSVTLILYVLISWIFINLLGYQLSIGVALIVIICYILFFSLSWCIYNEFCFTQTYIELNSKDTDSYQVKFLKKIKRKIQEIRDANKIRNILVNGSWGAGKSYFIESHLKQTPSLVYLSCTDYADTHELITALIEKTNNCLFRWLVRLSITRILAIIGKFELKQFIGINKVIVFDEFERLVDYNKIDPMHIVSLIQYLNNQKNCICILVANDEPLNNNSQFTNVREKLISYTYNYRLPFEDAIKIIKDRNNESTFVDLESIQFSEIRKDLYNRYQIDNNIRIIEHKYIKINQIYQLNKNFTDFKRSDNSIHITNEEFFTLLFSNVLDFINPLYYLYLKNPYNLKAIETLAIVYMSKKLEKPATNEENNKSILKNYLDKNSIQSLALDYLNKDIISHKNCDSELYDVSYNLNYIITNQNFENINAKLITEFLGNEKIVIQLILHNGEYGKTLNQNIKIFTRLFKETFCENDSPELIEDYFKSINVLEQRFLRSVNDDKNSSWDDSIVTDYIAYCKYIDDAWHRGNPSNIIPISYSRVAYINALIIQTINDSTSNIKLITEQIIGYNKPDFLISLIYELTCTQTVKQNKTNELIKLVQQIMESLSGQYNPITLLDFMYFSYEELKKALLASNINANSENAELIVNPISLCNKNLISLLIPENKSPQFINRLFMHLSNFNDGILMKSFSANSLSILIDKIKEVFNTPILRQEFIKTYKDHVWNIPKLVADELQKELDNNKKNETPETEGKE